MLLTTIWSYSVFVFSANSYPVSCPSVSYFSAFTSPNFYLYGIFVSFLHLFRVQTYSFPFSFFPPISTKFLHFIQTNHFRFVKNSFFSPSNCNCSFIHNNYLFSSSTANSNHKEEKETNRKDGHFWKMTVRNDRNFFLFVCLLVFHRKNYKNHPFFLIIYRIIFFLMRIDWSLLFEWLRMHRFSFRLLLLLYLFLILLIIECWQFMDVQIQ